MENYLNESQDIFNEQQPNVYREKWGSVFEFLHDNHHTNHQSDLYVLNVIERKQSKLQTAPVSPSHTNQRLSTQLESGLQIISFGGPVQNPPTTAGTSFNRVRQSIQSRIQAHHPAPSTSMYLSQIKWNKEGSDFEQNSTKLNDDKLNQVPKQNDSNTDYVFKNNQKQIILYPKKPVLRQRAASSQSNDYSFISHQNSQLSQNDKQTAMSTNYRLRSHNVTPRKNFIINKRDEINQIKSSARSIVAAYRERFHTALGSDIRNFGIHDETNEDTSQQLPNPRLASKINHLQNAIKRTADLNVHEAKKSKDTSVILNNNNKQQRNSQASLNNRLSLKNENCNFEEKQIKQTRELMKKKDGTSVFFSPKKFNQNNNNLQSKNNSLTNSMNNLINKGTGSYKKYHQQKLSEQGLEIPKEFEDELNRILPQDNIQQLLHITPEQFINMQNTQNWMKKHKFDQEKFLTSRTNIEFAKQLFKIWDEDGSGKLEMDEITLPLIALGMSNESTFVEKLLSQLKGEAHSGLKLKKGEKNQTQITLKDFAKVFKQDQISDKITTIIKDIIKKQKETKSKNINNKDEQNSSSRQNSNEQERQEISSPTRIQIFNKSIFQQSVEDLVKEDQKPLTSATNRNNIKINQLQKQQQQSSSPPRTAFINSNRRGTFRDLIKLGETTKNGTMNKGVKNDGKYASNIGFHKKQISFNQNSYNFQFRDDSFTKSSKNKDLSFIQLVPKITILNGTSKDDVNTKLDNFSQVITYQQQQSNQQQNYRFQFVQILPNKDSKFAPINNIVVKNSTIKDEGSNEENNNRNNISMNQFKDDATVADENNVNSQSLQEQKEFEVEEYLEKSTTLKQEENQKIKKDQETYNNNNKGINTTGNVLLNGIENVEHLQPLKFDTKNKSYLSFSRKAVKASQPQKSPLVDPLSLNEQLLLIRQWWSEIDKGKGNLSQPVEKVAQLLVAKKIAAEQDTAIRIIWKMIKKRKHRIDWEDFNMIFCKGIFKDVLITLARRINTQTNKDSNDRTHSENYKDLSLQAKINDYQRSLMLEQIGTGIIPNAQVKQKIVDRPVLYSLYQFKKQNNHLRHPDENYKQFKNDPFGTKRQEIEEERKRELQSDKFDNSIKFFKDQKTMQRARQELQGLDKEVNYHFTYYENLKQMVKDGIKFQNEQYKGWKIDKEERVKIPKVYLEKKQEDRAEDQSQLLRRFQNVINSVPQDNYDL